MTDLADGSGPGTGAPGRSRWRWRGPAAGVGAGLMFAGVAGAAALGLWIIMQTQGGAAPTDSLGWATTLFGIGGSESGGGEISVGMIVAFVVLSAMCAVGLMFAAASLIWLTVRGTREAAKSDAARASVERSKELSRQAGSQAQRAGSASVRLTSTAVGEAKSRVAKLRGSSDGGSGKTPPPF